MLGLLRRRRGSVLALSAAVACFAHGLDAPGQIISDLGYRNVTPAPGESGDLTVVMTADTKTLGSAREFAGRVELSVQPSKAPDGSTVVLTVSRKIDGEDVPIASFAFASLVLPDAKRVRVVVIPTGTRLLAVLFPDADSDGISDDG